MNSDRSPLQIISSWISQTRVRAFGIAIAVLAILAVLQVKNLQRDAPMCELLTGSQLQNEELQRMQIAFSQAGLNEFQIKNHRMLVPTSEHSKYMQAAADKHAIPSGLVDDHQSNSISNPLMSRSQQKAIALANKKQQIRDMVMRLPFVDHAWFEMDRSESGNAFTPARHSAVISIRTPPQTVLTSRHAETVKKMITGAVADLTFDDIVVIDIQNGMAHQDAMPAVNDHDAWIQRVGFEQKRHYENQIREALADYPSLKIQVHVNVEELKPVDKIALAPTVAPAMRRPELPTAGANGVASIEADPEPLPTIQTPTPFELVNHTTRRDPVIEKRVNVEIGVPDQLVFSLKGTPATGKNQSQKSREQMIQRETQKKFAQVKTEILRRVTPLLPRHGNTNGNVAVNLLSSERTEAIAKPAWPATAQTFLVRNWPSLAVLIIGMGLLTIVTRQSNAPRPTDASLHNEDHDVLSINGTPAPESAEAPEVRLTQLIEQDPDAAAKIIETWIRDAA